MIGESVGVVENFFFLQSVECISVELYSAFEKSFKFVRVLRRAVV